MGRSGVSSKRKYSKKKSLKLSSEDRRKKKSRRNKSKKLHRHDDSFSSYSDDESSSSSLVSSSSSEGEYKSKRSRSRARNEIKGTKKQTRRRSLSEDSSDDSLSPPVKKRKGSKKKSDRKNKKIKKKKKYISSASSDSESCSTCRDDGDGGDEGASHGKPRGKSREKKKDHRDSIKARIGSRKNRSRTRSSSPSHCYDDDVIEKVAVENNSRRLKSVITVAKLPENEEGDDMKKDELKEEIVYDYDDYPSCRSNDSNDGENKKELADRFNVSPEKLEVNSPAKSASNIESEVDNLESILRQKALENLSKFRGGLQTKSVVSDDKKHKSDQSGVDLGQTQRRLPAPEQSQPVIQRSRFTWRRDPSVTTGKEEKAATNTGASQAAAPKLQSTGLSSKSRVENKIVNVTSKIISKSDNSIGDIRTDVHQKSTTDVDQKATADVDQKATADVDQKTTTALETPSSAFTKEGSSNEQQTETNNNSQFEKKTMSVMRGGEMVQVSYKVYIPNRAPALARRKLKR